MNKEKVCFETKLEQRLLTSRVLFIQKNYFSYTLENQKQTI